jgi:hypothetical protein
MNKTQINNRIYRFTKTNINSYPMADMTDDENVALDRVASLIMKADNRWQFDDTNESDLPIATTALVSGQQDYSLDISHLDVTRVEIQDTNGKWHLLKPIDQSDVPHESLAQFAQNRSRPEFYDKIGNSVFLYPTPSYGQAASLKLWFKRGPSYFLTTDTTKTPGFNALYHDLIVLWPSYDYAVANGMANANQIFTAIELKEAALTNDYSTRSPEKLVLRPKHESSR